MAESDGSKGGNIKIIGIESFAIQDISFKYWPVIGFKSEKVLQAVNAMHATIQKSVIGTMILKDFIRLVLELAI